MPELPEVETVRRGLELSILGATIRKAVTRRGDLRVPFPPNLAKALAGRTIEKIDRRAKYLLFYFDSDDVLIMHLGMSGRFLIEESEPESFGAHDHLIWYLADGRLLVFNDARRFGLAALTARESVATHKLLTALGPEPLEKSFSPAYLAAALEKRKGPLKPVLMDQSLVVGVGNIYASEALFVAGISPERPAFKAAGDAKKIVAAIRKVLKSAIASGGSSLRDFLHITGKAGYFQHHFYVYGRDGEPCRVCGETIRIGRQAGRSTFYCPHCQS